MRRASPSCRVIRWQLVHFFRTSGERTQGSTHPKEPTADRQSMAAVGGHEHSPTTEWAEVKQQTSQKGSIVNIEQTLLYSIHMNELPPPYQKVVGVKAAIPDPLGSASAISDRPSGACSQVCTLCEAASSPCKRGARLSLVWIPLLTELAGLEQLVVWGGLWEFPTGSLLLNTFCFAFLLR